MSEEVERLALATDLTVAWLANPNTRASVDDVPAFLASVHAALGTLSSPADAGSVDRASEPAPAVSVRKSLASRDRIVSMIDGKPYASLKRHLVAHGLTPDEYRERFGLKRDYPMVAPGYSEARSAMSKRLGLGRKPTAKADAPIPQQPELAATDEPKGKGPGRKRLGIAGAKAAVKEHLGGAKDA